ncbi:serine/threonine/tyrosine-interacting-like protein 2 [Pseudoliparis swirei]|uniref:serine/threonine/tyrosine-interacting-like protein 2 n=1 Tax=Pseudoliparis swirei TaxID=2059687 RepID=UPI0024BED8A7|nr:serine/threonine/tyrosine-interacting-like protein 2 [Pseudoliparis swirei]
MASTNESGEHRDQTVPGSEEEEEEENQRRLRGIQSHYLRCPSPSFSTASESRFSLISGSDAASIFMEPIHLSSAIAAKKIIGEELPPRSVQAESVPESMLETAEQLMVEDLYNRVRDMTDDRSPYNTPCVLDLQRAMVQARLEAPPNPVDEVWPGVFIAEKSVAVNKARLKRMGVTHVLNAAHGTGVYTGESFYAGMTLQYLGIEVDDFPDADISPHFRPTAEFLDDALLTHKGKVLVVSMMGVSRAAVLVASYLMIFQHMSVMEALSSVRKKRAINPNEGFLKQLRALNEALMEEREDDDDTLSQCSVVDARARARIFGEEEEEDDEEEERSMVGVKAHSIVMEEEEDGQSVMSSVASSAFRSTPTDQRPARREVVLPETGGGGGGEEEEEEEEDGLDSMIREWQRRNEKYQDDGWWEAQLDSDGEDGECVGEGGRKEASPDAESVTSEEVRAVKERPRRRVRRPASDAGSSSSSMSYSDLWKRRLKEMEEQAAARYRRKEDEGGGTEGGRKKMDEEVESLLSDSGSMYNFCHKNKDKMTPLERWRVKRIQFGWNKKDREGGGGAETPAHRDVDLTAYQTWKLRQQRRLGEENKEEVVEMSRGEDSAMAKRRQRREEILERSKKTLEESRSMCGWEAETHVSGGAVPLSAFWAGATGTPSVANDDAASALSGRSSVVSSVSQPRGARSVAPVPPILPVPTLPGPGGEPMVNLASIQNWIAEVVSETIRQKQTEMSPSPPSRAGSEFRSGSLVSGRGAEDDSASLWSAASCSRGPGGALLSGSSVSGLTGRSSAPGPKRNKITGTSVPLCSLFQDQVDMGKLDAMDREMKAEMRGKMAAYERKKILEDNKRSTMYKKKKPKDDEEEQRKKKEEDFLAEAKKEKKPARTFGLSGCLNLSPALEREKNTSVDDWLASVRPPPNKMAAAAAGQSDDDLHASASEFDFSSRRASYALDEDEEALGVPSGFGSQDARGGSAAALGSRRPESGEAAESFAERRPARRSRYEGGVEGGSRSGREGAGKTQEEEEEDDVTTFIAQTRQRARARAAAEADDHEVLEAWRAQQDARALSGAPRRGRTDADSQ